MNNRSKDNYVMYLKKHLDKKITNFGSQIIWYNSLVISYNSIVAFNPTTKKGIVILYNSMIQDIDIATIGFDPDDKLLNIIWNLNSQTEVRGTKIYIINFSC